MTEDADVGGKGCSRCGGRCHEEHGRHLQAALQDELLQV